MGFRNQATLRALSTLMAVMLLGGCAEEAAPIPPPSDTWYRAVDQQSHTFYPLPPYIHSPVKTEHLDEAITAMGDGPLLQLSTSEAIRYADDPLRTVRELRPFLIHGLYRSKRLFNISIADRALWVDSADDPDDSTPTHRQPIVLYIDEVPPDVYVTVGWRLAEAAAQANADGETE
ncbi:MAG: hypothetical protein O3C28_06590 [Proteobacteria bacterium]|nr:hypothetical protein [Pseudomonadota bacterium]